MPSQEVACFQYFRQSKKKIFALLKGKHPSREPRPPRYTPSMRVQILGSAAGGAFPQWNCTCPNCRALRAGIFHGKARTQTQVAVSNDERSWFLLGASPDLRFQIEATPELHPQSETKDGVRQSPIAGAVLANADIDHVLGLLLMRGLQPLRVPGQVTWTDFVPGTTFPLLTAAGEDSGLRCRALSLGTHYPAYVSRDRQSHLKPGEASLGLIIESPSGKRLAYMPAVPQIDDALLKEFESADALLFDGTFWSDDELIRIQGSGQTAAQMGHVPVSSTNGSLSRLAQLRRPRRIYVHINNTNPMLNEAGPEHRQVLEAGWEIAEDGWRFEI